MKKAEMTGILGALDLRSPRIKLLYAIVIAVMIIISCACILPLLWLILSSLKDIKEFYAIPPMLIPNSLHFDKLLKTWQEFKFTRYYLNTAYLTIGSVVSCLIFNGLAGYFFSKLKPRGSALMFVLIVWTMLLPSMVGMIPLFKNIIDFPLLHINFTNTFWPMWLMAAANPVVILIFKSFFDEISQSLLEAAKIDGAPNRTILTRIMLPLSVPVISTITILTVNSVWMDFFWPYMVLKDQAHWTIIVAIFNLRASTPMDLQFIALTFAVLPPILLFLFFQKYIMQGYTFSGIKG